MLNDSGEFTLWNGLTFNFETILQAHDTAVQAMKWSHNDTWMITGDRSGYIKVRKCQKQIFMTSILPKNKRFFPDSALASKMGQIQKIRAHYYTNYGLFNITKCLYIFF